MKSMQASADVPLNHSAFTLERTQFIDSLNLEVQEFRHKETQAVHYHMASDNPENVFLVGVRTMPSDSRGVAHILEHTVLCGSERYPVRDPFFMMLRRSLNTFMNAFTSSDWTAYPFASQNKKDYYNLLSVYLDAVFFARLDPLDFAQEGHRMEFAESGDKDSDLVFKGVVFNEMKGAMSSPISVLWQTITGHLFPTTTYHFNSGGEPEDIPDLSYDQLMAFYRSHYHPSNAVFMTYGDIPARDIQQCIEEQVLHRFEQGDTGISVPHEQRFDQPKQVTEHYAAEPDEADGLDGKTHHVLAWLLGDSTNLPQMLKAHLLSNVLLNDSASPLRLALETSDLGSAPSPLCGLEDSNREMSFMCGLEGCKTEDADAVEALVLSVLQEVADKGVPQEQVEAVLHQLELSQREVKGDGYPYGLQLILSGLSAAVHRGDPIAVMNIDPALDELRASIQDPDFIKGAVQELLLANTHRVRLSLLPDDKLNSAKEVAEAARLEAAKASMDDAEKTAVVTQAEQLQERQQQQDDLSILPKVGIEDVPTELAIPEGEKQDIGEGLSAAHYVAGTNGLVYQQVIVELPELEDELLALLPCYTSCLTELGCGDRDYLQMQAWQSQVSGGIHASTSVRGSVQDEQAVKGYFVLSAKALERNHENLSELTHATFSHVRFDEHERIKDIISQKRLGAEQSVIQNGHSLAMQAAASGLSPVASLNHRLGGLAGIKTLKALDNSLQDEQGGADAVAQLAQRFAAIHERILAAPREFLVVGEAGAWLDQQQALAGCWRKGAANDGFEPFSLPETRRSSKQLWLTGTQVNFCAKAYATVPVDHPDAASLTVLAEFMRNGYLHSAVREQGGAYGGGASHDSGNAAFRFYSYRDPRLSETLEDFDAAIQWVQDNDHDEAQLEEAILGVVGSMDKPGSPAGEAKSAHHNALFGRTPEQRRGFRQGVLEVTLDDLRRVSAAYLKPENASVAVVTDASRADKVAEVDSFERFTL